MYTEYVALGDALSLDLYPALDAGETDVAVALERVASAGAVAPIGAASLLHTNDDARWPEERGDDLVTRYPGIELRTLAEDGATIGDVFGEQLPALGASDVPTLVSLTAGSTDVFSAYRNRPGRRLLERIAGDVAGAIEALVERVFELRPEATLLLTTLLDPSDRTGRVPGVLEGAGRLPLAPLDEVNRRIRALAAARPGRIALADAYVHFLGHGASVLEPERWYWRRSPLEPNARGAHELRRVWLAALERHEAGL